jgi:type 1 glutamine amidotransferase
LGKTPDEPALPPVAWTNQRTGGGQSFYTSMGHVDDFAQPEFQKMLRNAVQWAVDHHQTK